MNRIGSLSFNRRSLLDNCKSYIKTQYRRSQKFTSCVARTLQLPGYKMSAYPCQHRETAFLSSIMALKRKSLFSFFFLPYYISTKMKAFTLFTILIGTSASVLAVGPCQSECHSDYHKCVLSQATCDAIYKDCSAVSSSIVLIKIFVICSFSW